MKRITHLVFVAVLTCGAQSAWANEPAEQAAAEASAESAEKYLNVAAIGGSVEKHSPAVEAPRARKPEGMLERLGLAGRDAFPSSGGPIDD